MDSQQLKELSKLSFDEFWNWYYWYPRAKAYAVWVLLINTYGE